MAKPGDSAEQDDKTDPALAIPLRPRPKSPPFKSLGPLDPFMGDPDITEIMVNDLRNVMIERDGKLLATGFTFNQAADLDRLVAILTEGSGRKLSPENPYLDLILPDGSRVNIVTPPVVPSGPCITIRKFPAKRFAMDDLVGHAMLDKKMAHFLHACVVGRMNILVSGGTGTGKTTLLGALAAYIPQAERVITIEDTPELALGQANSVKMISQLRTATSPGVSARELVANAMRMRPDRLVVGECRTAEAFDMLQAMNTGHQGSMTTIHANSPRDALSRLETLCLMAGADLPLVAIRKQINGAVNLIVQVKRFRNGKRRVTAITEITGIEGDVLTLQDIYLYATDAARADTGSFKCTGYVPTFLERLRDQGVELGNGYFS